MPLNIPIPEDSLAGFSDPAKARLQEAIKEFGDDLIDEANRLESGRNGDGADPEVTRGMVSDAAVLLRRGLNSPKKSAWIKALRIAAGVMPFLVGLMYDKQSLQNSLYLLAFFVLAALTILAVTLSVLKE